MRRVPNGSDPESGSVEPGVIAVPGAACAVDVAAPGATVRPHTTMRDVAKRARVSLMTVSNVINRKPGTVTPETRARVEQAIAELNYRPHFSGRNLRLAKRLSVGLIIVAQTPNYLADPFTSQVVAGLSNHLNEGCYSLTLQGLRPENFTDALCIQNLRTDGLCGLIGGGAAEREACVGVLRRLGLPIVLFEDWSDVAGADVCAVRQDNRGGAAAIATHLVERGSRRLLWLAPDQPCAAIHQRLLGVQSAMAGLDGVELEILHVGSGSSRDAYAALEARYPRGDLPDGILGANDAIGLGALRYARSRGLEVPGQVRIAGFDGDTSRWNVAPLLTTVRSMPYELGTRGAAALIERLESGTFRTQAITLPVIPEFCEST